MGGLALALIPLIPAGLDWILRMIETIRNDAGTPAALQAQLEKISIDLVAINKRVQAVELPPPGSGR